MYIVFILPAIKKFTMHDAMYVSLAFQIFDLKCPLSLTPELGCDNAAEKVIGKITSFSDQ
jgi:hypothetical protein